MGKMRTAQAVTPNRLLTLSQAAGYLNCSVVTVRRLIWSGQLPIVQWDRRQRLDPRDLERFVDQHKIRETL